VSRAPAVVALAAALVAGCANRDADPGGRGASSPSRAERPLTSPRAKESHVFEVKTTDDLPRLRVEYMRLWSRGTPGELAVKIDPSAALQATGWALEPEHAGDGDALIDVVITGAGGVLPLPDRIFAHSLRLEDVVLTGGRSGPSEIRVATGFTMRRSMLIDGRLTDPHWQGGFIEVFADGGNRTAATVTIEDCWFVRNFQSERPARMIDFTQRGEDAGYFDKVRVVRSAFLGNAFAADLSVQYARTVSVEDSLFFRNWPGPGSEIACSHCEAVVVTGSTFAVEKAEQVAAVDKTQPVLLKSSRVLARGWKAGAALPAALDPATASQMADRAAFTGDAAVAEAITRAAAQPLRVPTAEAWTRLRAAFGG